MPFKAIARKIQVLFVRFLMLAMVLEGVFVSFAPLPAHAAIANGAPAIDVMGEYDDSITNRVAPIFTKNGLNNGPNSLGLNAPQDVAFDSVHHRLFVGDVFNSRLLVYSANTDGSVASKVPLYVIGQPNFNSNAGGVTQTTVDPYGIAYDSVHDRLFVSDNNSRVLVYNLASGISNNMNAAYVLGQPNFTAQTGTRSRSGIGQTPYGLAYDSVIDRLFVAIQSENRVLVFNLANGVSNGMNASYVLGQSTFTDDNGTTSQTGLNGPTGLAFDTTGRRLFVSEASSQRVKMYDLSATTTTNMPAAKVLGQIDFDTNGQNEGSGFSQASCNVGDGIPNACGMAMPSGLSYDASGNRLFVDDTTNYRVMVFNLSPFLSDGKAASYVIGQPDFTTTTQNKGSGFSAGGCNVGNGNPNACGMNYPVGVSYAGSRLLVSEQNNNRVLSFDLSATTTSGIAATDVIGQYDGNSSDLHNTTVSYVRNGANNGPNRYTLAYIRQPAFDTVHHRLFVGDGNSNRVVVYNLNSDNTLPDKSADYVLGQADFAASTSGGGSTGMYGPAGLAYDASGDRLFVSDGGNNRVLVYNTASISNGEAAVNVLGQPNMGSTGAATSATEMNGPVELAYDASGNRLFVADGGNHRVLEFDFGGGLTDGMAASRELGQPSGTAFTSNGANFDTGGPGYGGGGTVSEFGFFVPVSVAYDNANSRLFVTDGINTRVLVFNISGGITNGMAASNVLGQPTFATATFNKGSGFADDSCNVNDGNLNACSLGAPGGLAYDVAGSRLFVGDAGDQRATIFDTTSITNGEPAVNVLGQPDFVTQNGAVNQTTANATTVAFDVTNNRLYVGDIGRVMIFDISTTSTATATTANAITLSRMKAGVAAVMTITFTLSHNLSTTLTVTLPSAFTITGAPTVGASSSCLSSFAFDDTAKTVSASKTNCSGPITLGGIAVINPVAAGSYHIVWVNDDPGGGEIIVTDEDQISITAAVDPSITFNVGSQASATACDGTFSANGGTVALGTLTTGAVTSSDASSVAHICTRVSTNATSGGIVTVKSANASLKSVTVPADTIPSTTQTVTAGSEGYGLCAGSAGADSDKDTTIPAGATPSRTSPFNGASCTSTGHDVGGLTTSAQQVWAISGPSANAFFRLYLKAAIAGTTKAHSDYTDTLTFVATGTF